MATAARIADPCHITQLQETVMIYTLAVVLLVLWLLGMVTSFTAGGLLHILLVLAVVAVVYQLITGRSVG
jgi:hypothetical protein